MLVSLPANGFAIMSSVASPAALKEVGEVKTPRDDPQDLSWIEELYK